ncbi:MAG: hypothetical protein HRU18_01470 [Pseudoalteromonas sp.]|uniref:hypothetical protein n=1 Tax=Pseudoalteromonas sp. TaxID=53249 RepID=UPI001D5C0EC4|nr:hypothetical protein [Pseudoalteromonas sp.]NRA76850.1 hypothetical protein [Pseudoalteromonas sp.]
MAIDSKYIKACLSAYFRFKRQTSCIATEVGQFNADFLAVGRGGFLEIEIKVSKADLNNDFKKPKHKIYETQKHHAWCPQQFYFAIPEELVDYAIAKCADKPYGILAIRKCNRTSNRSWMDRVRVVKRAKKLHNNPIQEKVKYIIYSRLASEMTNLRIALCD